MGQPSKIPLGDGWTIYTAILENRDEEDYKQGLGNYGSDFRLSSPVWPMNYSVRATSLLKKKKTYTDEPKQLKYL